MTDIMKLPPSAHIGILRQFIERERMMRVRVLKGESQRKGIEDTNNALASLEELQVFIHQLKDETI